MTAISSTAEPDTETVAPSRWRRAFVAVAGRLENLTLAQLTLMIWASTFFMSLVLLGSSRTTITGTMNITENWGAIERVALWQDFLEPVIPRFTLPTGVIAWGFRAALLLGFIAQAGAFLVVMRARNPSPWKWMIGPLGGHAIMTLMMAPTNSDVFFYEAVGDLAANGYNPYIHELMDFPDHPLIPYNYWIDIGTVYGPLWVNYNRVVMAIAGPDPIIATLLQKVLAGVVALALVGVVYWFAKLLGGNATLATAAAVLVAWQPNMLIETSGQVHNDPHTVLIATLGLAMAILGGFAGLRGGIMLVAASVMVKFITLPLLGVMGIIRLAERLRPNPAQRILGNWLIDGIGILAVVLASFLPYWDGFHTIEEMLAEPSRLYTHPIWRFIQSALGFLFPDVVSDVWNAFTRPLLQVTSISLFVGIVAWLGWKIWKDPRLASSNEDEETDHLGLPWWTRHVLYAWMLMFLALAYVPVNSHPWYWVWPVAAVPLVIAFDLRGAMDRWSVRMLPTWFWVYLWGNALLTLMYHTRIARY